MSFAALAEIALRAPEWLLAWNALELRDIGFSRALVRAGLGKPTVLAGLRVDRTKLESMIRAMGLAEVGQAELQERLDYCQALQVAARPAGDD